MKPVNPIRSLLETALFGLLLLAHILRLGGTSVALDFTQAIVSVGILLSLLPCVACGLYCVAGYSGKLVQIDLALALQHIFALYFIFLSIVDPLWKPSVGIATHHDYTWIGSCAELVLLVVTYVLLYSRRKKLCCK